MSESDEAETQRRYVAFISYSNIDEAEARWLQKALERTVIPKPLRGQPSPIGPVPKRLTPVFRDLTDLPAGANLDAALKDRLDAAHWLIVVCSPNAAASHWVNEEVKYFIETGRRDRILTVIIDGVPNDPEAECFPPALRGPDEPLAADLRGDRVARRDGLLRLAAGLIGKEFDDFRQRQIAAARRRLRVFQAVALIMGLLAVSATGAAWIAYQQTREAERRLVATLEMARGIVDNVVAINDRYDVPRPVVQEFLERADSAFETIFASGVATADLRQQHGWVLLRFSEFYRVTGDTARQRQRAQGAVEIFSQLADGYPSNLPYRSDLSISYDALGLAQTALGDLESALASYRLSLEIRQGLVASDPENTAWMRDLSVSWDRIGRVRQAQGNLAAALEAYQTGLNLERQLLDADPGNVMLQRDISVSLERIGQIRAEQGDILGALETYETVLDMRQKLLDADPANTQWQRDLSITLNRIGILRRIQGNLPAALEAYKRSLSIVEGLVAFDPANTVWQKDVAITQSNMGDAYVQQGDLPNALSVYQSSLQIRIRLAATDPANTDLQRDLMIAWSKLGDVMLLRVDLNGALEAYQTMFGIVDTLAKQDPDNAQWQNDLAFSYWKLGDVRRNQGKHQQALEAYRASLAIQERLIASDPENKEWLRGAAVVWNKIGNTFVTRNSFPEALDAYEQALNITQSLADADPNNFEWQYDRALSLSEVARIHILLLDYDSAYAAYDGAVESARQLVAANPTNADWLNMLVRALFGRGWSLALLDRLEEALRDFREAKERVETLHPMVPPNWRGLQMFEAGIDYWITQMESQIKARQSQQDQPQL